MKVCKKHCCLCVLNLYINLHTQGPIWVFVTPYHVFNIYLYCYMHMKFISSKCCMVLQGVQTIFHLLISPSDGHPDSSTSSCMSHYGPGWIIELWVPNLIEHCQITVQNGATCLHSLQQCRRVPIIQHPNQILYYLTFYFCHSHRV